MDQEKKQQMDGVDKETDVTRSENQQAQNAASGEQTERRPAGSVNKGNPEHNHGSHREGEYSRQSDDPTMRPSGMDEEK